MEGEGCGPRLPLPYTLDMGKCLLHRNCDWETVNQAAKQLRDALLEAEEMYLEAED